MTWAVSAHELDEGVEERRRMLGERRAPDTLERLARALRWVDDLEESRRVFHEAAVAQVQSVEQHGRPSAATHSRTAGYFALAGELEPAREWAARAIDELLEPRDPYGDVRPEESRHRDAGEAVELWYVSGEPDRALTLAREQGIRNRAVELIEAERDRDVDAVDAVIGGLTTRLVAERVPPHVAGGHPIGAWDWLELAFETRAGTAGEPTPTHREMLERTGLLGGGPSRRVARLEEGGVDRFTVDASDGSPIEATVDRERADWIEITLDPREEHYLSLGFDWYDDRGYRSELYLEPESSPQVGLPYVGTDFGEAVDAAADWLDGRDVLGRDGTWAARTLRQITKDLPVRES